ncbi:MAG: hypothetical protein BGO70_01260 [Bacteroidetes bacterium 43-93]|uniref:DUF4403 family protein n=1 Tax=uncultured Dysgonomonas sp. TaxID=206096 RepID=UPI00092A2E1B|nr:DUF4403 family protein [uncultured Dysgonomonas sp.]MBN9483096.1 DUF4403 family protein [Bacteroidota bacterium]OJW96339.1 MAG: hypothetical protein BGO70_01260 [Bacteroidetes bacterium 43-93]
MKHFVFSLLSLFVFYTGYASKLKPKRIIYSYNAIYKPSTAPISSLCFGLQINLGAKPSIDNLFCEYLSGHYSDIALDLPGGIPIVYAVDVDYQVWRGIPLDVFLLSGNSITIKELFYYSADGHVIVNGIPIFAQCGWDDEEARRIEFGATTSLSFDTNYFIRSNTKPIDASVPDGFRCLVTTFNKDVTNNLTNLVNSITSQEAVKLDQLINSATNFKPQAQQLWDFLCTPIKLNDSRYLNFNPLQFSIEDINFSEDDVVRVNSTLGLRLQPAVTSAPQACISTLPPLNNGHCSSNFDIEYDLNSKIVDFNKSPVIVDKSIYSRKFETPKRKLSIRQIEFGYLDDRSIVKLNVLAKSKLPKNPSLADRFGYFFSSIFYKRKGDIYLTSYLNSDGYSIRLSDTKFETNSAQQIKKKASWISSTDLISYLESSLVIDNKFEVLNLQEQLRRYLNNEISANLSISSGDLRVVPTQIFFYKDRIIMRILLAASPVVQIKIP